GAHRLDRERPGARPGRVAAGAHRGAAGQLRLPEQVLHRRYEVLLSFGHPGGARGRDPQRGAQELPRARLPRLGPRGRDATAERRVLLPRDEHLAGHDRPQPRADSGEGRGPWLCRPLREDPAGRAPRREDAMTAPVATLRARVLPAAAGVAMVAVLAAG